ncbi:MAG: hypothetical protein J7647_30475 [Cyanobacteria bacterium SBLK]|nr:hypothetical protein [Cyanobacteria bacterium SBLK]
MESSSQDDYEAKEKVFYSAMISAWLNTKMERDKQLLGLSATAIGLLVTLLRTTNVNNVSQIIIFGLAMFFFLMTVIAVLGILDQNSKHIEKTLDNRDVNHKTLKYLDKIAECSFIIGMALIVIIGIQTAILSLDKK